MTNVRGSAFILFGPPGSGKGTQAELLAQHLSLPHIATGDMLREQVRASHQRGAEIKGFMQAGNLVPDEFVNELIANRIAQPDCTSGFILDGYPRTLRQGQTLLHLLETRGIRPVVVHFKIDHDVVLARLSGRRQCPQCGAVYNLVTHPPKNDERCDKDGSELIVREDDREVVIRNRLKAYDKQAGPLLDYFKRAGTIVHDVDMSRVTPEQITTRIIGTIKSADQPSSNPS